MIRYIKGAAQVMVLTAVLVFSGLLVANTGFVTSDADAADHETVTVHETIFTYKFRNGWGGVLIHYDYLGYYDHVYYE